MVVSWENLLKVDIEAPDDEDEEEIVEVMNQLIFTLGAIKEALENKEPMEQIFEYINSTVESLQSAGATAILKAYDALTSKKARKFFIQNLNNNVNEEAQKLRMLLFDTDDDDVKPTLEELLRMYRSEGHGPNSPIINLIQDSLSYFREEEGRVAYV